MDIIAMKNINGFLINNEARQQEFERKCMRLEDVAARNIKLNKEIWELEKELEHSDEAKWEINAEYDTVMEMMINLSKQITLLTSVNIDTTSDNLALQNKVIKEKKQHTTTKRRTTRKINKLESKIQDMQKNLREHSVVFRPIDNSPIPRFRLIE